MPMPMPMPMMMAMAMTMTTSIAPLMDDYVIKALSRTCAHRVRQCVQVQRVVQTNFRVRQNPKMRWRRARSGLESKH